MTYYLSLLSVGISTKLGTITAALNYSAMHQQECTIQLFAAAKCPFLDILLQQIAESYILVVHASLSKLTRPIKVAVAEKVLKLRDQRSRS